MAADPRGEALDATFGALSDPTRRAVVAMLRHRPWRAGELATGCSTTAPAMSRHLRVLRHAGLVEEAFDPVDARARVYSLKRERFDDLQAWLGEITAFWQDQLAAFAAHVEAKAGGGGRGGADAAS